MDSLTRIALATAGNLSLRHVTVLRLALRVDSILACNGRRPEPGQVVVAGREAVALWFETDNAGAFVSTVMSEEAQLCSF